MQLTVVLVGMEDRVLVADRLQIGEQIHEMRCMRVFEDDVGPVPSCIDRSFGEASGEAW